MPAAVVIRGLRKSFREREALRGLDLDVAAGSVFGLVGPNGSGKTTLFRILAGLLPPSAGSVRLLGGEPASPAVRAGVGYMTQAEALYDDLTVAENVRFFGRLYGLAGAALRTAAAEAIALVQLTDRAAGKVHALSGGMRRRASLACAIVHRPRLLLLDEPTAGVDPELRAQFWDAFRAWAAAGRTLLVATHHLDEAIHCDTILLLREGRLIAQGAPAALLAQTGAATLEQAFLVFAGRTT